MKVKVGMLHSSIPEPDRTDSVMASGSAQKFENGSKIGHHQNSMSDISSFKIRKFVATVRAIDFSKCWPFRQKILEKSLNLGIKPFLPPFDPPTSEDCQSDSEYEALACCQQMVQKQSKEKSRKNDTLVPVSNQPSSEDSANCGIAGVLVKENVFQQVIQKQGDDSCLVTTAKQPSPESANCSETGELTKESPTPICKQPSVESANCGEAGALVMEHIACSTTGTACASAVDTNVTGCIRETSSNDNDMSFKTDSERLEDANALLAGKSSSDKPGVESSSQHFKIVESEAVPNDDSETGVKENCTVTLQQKDMLSSSSHECLTYQNQEDCKNDNVNVSGKVCQELVIPPCQEMKACDVLDSSPTTTESVDFQSKSERNRNSDDFGLTSLNLDSLIPQVCPVCLNFTSTSNTALNAHIDHCLESVLPCEKGESKNLKNRIKPRKMRSMMEICAVAPRRTLEDLELSSKIWALDDTMGTDDLPSCSLGWRGRIIQRHLKTNSAFHNPAWEAHDGFEARNETDENTDLQKHNALESVGEKLRCSKPKICGSRSKSSDFEDESELEELHKEVKSLRPSQRTLSVHLMMTKSRKKRRSSKPDTPEVTIIDTSADEERRLLLKFNHPQHPVSDEDISEQDSMEAETVSDHCDGSQSWAITNAKHERKMPVSETRRLDVATKKRKLSQVNLDWSQECFVADTVDEDASSDLHNEKQMKSKKTTKIKSLVTLVAAEKQKIVCGEVGSHKKSSIHGLKRATRDEGITTSVHKLSQGRSLKRKNLINTKIKYKGEPSDRSRHNQSSFSNPSEPTEFLEGTPISLDITQDSGSLTPFTVELVSQSVLQKDMDNADTANRDRVCQNNTVDQSAENVLVSSEQRKSTSDGNLLAESSLTPSKQSRIPGVECQVTNGCTRVPVLNASPEDPYLINTTEATNNRAIATSGNNIPAGPSLSHQAATRSYATCNPNSTLGCHTNMNDLSFGNDGLQYREQHQTTLQRPTIDNHMVSYMEYGPTSGLFQVSPFSTAQVNSNNGRIFTSSERPVNHWPAQRTVDDPVLRTHLYDRVKESGNQIMHPGQDIVNDSERLRINRNQSIYYSHVQGSAIDKRNVFSRNKIYQRQVYASSSEAYKNSMLAENCCMQENFSSIVSSAPGVLLRDGQSHDVDGCTAMSCMQTGLMPLSFDMLDDFSRGLPDKSQDIMAQKYCVMNDLQPRTVHCTSNDSLLNCHYSKLQAANMNKGSLQPQALQAAMKGRPLPALMIEGDPTVGHINPPGRLANTSSICGNMTPMTHAGGQSLPRAELNPNLDAYVFKLMGKNVMVSNNNIKSLAVENAIDQHTQRSFHPSSSLRQFGLLPEGHNYYSPDMFASSAVKSYPGDSCKSRNCSRPHAIQKMSPNYCVETPTYGMHTSPSSIERSHISHSVSELRLRKQTMFNNTNKSSSQFCMNDSLPNGNASLSSTLHGGVSMAPFNDMTFQPTNHIYYSKDPQMQTPDRAPQSNLSGPFLNSHRLRQAIVSGACNQGSGTLADIVQSSESNSSRFWSPSVQGIPSKQIP